MSTPSAARLAVLGRFLDAYQPLWAERTFPHGSASWEQTHPEVAAWLHAASPELLARCESAPYELAAAAAPTTLLRWADEARELTQLESLADGQRAPGLPEALRWHVPGRKAAQVTAFAAALRGRLSGRRPLVDWCAGKGYLGRLLVSQGHDPVYALEHDGDRCRAGRALDARGGGALHWICADVHDTTAHDVLPGAEVVALHACGELHRELIERGIERGASLLAVAPCCFHREYRRRVPLSDEPSEPWALAVPPPPSTWAYRPLSRAARAAELELDEHALRLATTHQVVATRRVITLRDRRRAYRLALDPLLREATGLDRYQPLPALPTAWLRLPFAGFVAKVAERLGLPALERDLEARAREAEAEGWRRLARVQALGLVRGIFRRAVELWLALDLACALEEGGYDVTLGTFCEPEVTPRNLLLVAARTDSSRGLLE